MKISNLLLTAITAALLMTGSARAEEQPGPVLKSEMSAGERLIRKMASPNVQVTKQFDAPLGLTGYVVTNGAKSSIIYTDKNGSHMVVGMIMDAQGNNLSKEHSDKYLPKPDISGILGQAKQAAWVEEGYGGGLVYVLADPNCGFCKKLFVSLREPIQNGHLRVRWIMTGFLADDSSAKAAEIMSAKDDKKRLAGILSKYMSGPAVHLKPGEKVSGNIAAEGLKESMDKNQKFMEANGISGTPFVIYKTKEGEIKAIPGMPQGPAMAEMIRVAGAAE